MVGFALAIGKWDPIWISLAAALALALNLFILPALTSRTLEKSEHQKFRWDPGLISYPLSVLIMSLIFWDHQFFIIVGWGAMAFGDPAAQYIGSRYGRKEIPWNPDKTYLGSLAFLIASGLGTFLLLKLAPEGIIPEGWSLVILLAAMLIATIAESLPGTINDNLVVPLGASGTAYVLCMGLPCSTWALAPDLWLGAGTVGIFVLLSASSGKIDWAGALMGGILAFLIFWAGSWAGLGSLFLLFVLGTTVSLIGRSRKAEWGIAQEDSGKRSVRHAFSNAGVAGILSVFALAFPQDAAPLILASIASLATATSDTFSSELGSLYGKRFVSILTWKSGRRGEDGLISLEGTAAGVLGAVLIAVPFILVAGMSWRFAAIIVVAAVGGNLVDSLLGATFQAWGLMTNDSVNFAATASGAGIAFLLV